MTTKTDSLVQWDWLLGGLMALLVYSASARLSLTDWTPGLWSVETLAVLGTALGLALGISRFAKNSVWLLAGGYSAVFIPWVLIQLIREEKTTLGQLNSLWGRVSASFDLLFHAQKITDSLFFVTLMCVLFWLIGVYSAFQLLRTHSRAAAVLPSAVPLLVIQYYDGYYHAGRLWTIGLYFFIALLLVGRVNFLENRERWKRENVFIGPEPEFDLLRGLTLTAALVVFAAWAAPTPETAIPATARLWQEVTRPFDATRKRFDDALAALNNGTQFVPAELYGATLNLGQNAGQGDQPVFTVQVSGPSQALRYYWRVRTYDVYRDGNWSISASEKIAFDSSTGATVEIGFPAARSSDFAYSWKTTPALLLVTPQNPLWVSRSGAFQAEANASSGYDLLSWSVSTPIERGDQYQVRAVILNPTIKELRAASASYPAWITERYLQLPANLSNRIRNLSGQITSAQTTPYDKTSAVTDYLRREMKYSLTLSAPPPGIDPIDWFLFAWKSGFCNYYATAEVLLLRSAGVPARLVAGYAQGAPQPGGLYLIQTKDAHAWPEVYFPNIGWVAFEPTASQPPIFRLSGQQNLTDPSEDVPSLEERLANRGAAASEPDVPAENNTGGSGDWRNPQILMKQVARQWVIILALLVFSGAAYWVARTKNRQSFSRRVPHFVKSFYQHYNLDVPTWVEQWVRWNDISAAERAFNVINQALNALGSPQPPSVTAAERVQVFKAILPEAAHEADLLAEAHEKTLFSLHPARSVLALQTVWKIRYFTWRAIFRRWLNGERENE